MTCQNLGVIEEGVEHDRNSALIRRSNQFRSAYYVALKSTLMMETLGAALERHISSSATLGIKCGRPHLMPEIRTSWFDERGGETERCLNTPKLPRLSSTLPGGLPSAGQALVWRR